MGFRTLALILAILPLLALSAPSQDAAWKDFKSTHKKNYGNAVEEAKRRGIFEERLKKIEKHNAEQAQGKQTFKMGINEFADQTLEELTSQLGAQVPKEQRDLLSGSQDLPSSDLPVDRQTNPAEIDLRTSPCMPAVKNQRSCGSCWAFAAINLLEFAHCTKNKLAAPVLLSEQNLVDCTYNQDGCQGGFYTTAWLNKNNTVSSADYPYVSGTTKTWNNGSCYFSRSPAVARVASYGSMSGESGIEVALSKGQPVAVAIQAVGDNFFFYKSGVYSDTAACDPTTIKNQINHAVTLVGYNNTANPGYWILRNSWGTTWGQNGYMQFLKGINLCNVGLWGRGNLTLV